MPGRGRPNKYFTHVKPRFKEIESWLELGATEKEIAENLGVNQKVFIKYKQLYAELNDLVKKGRRKPVMAIKAALFKRAIGFSYEEQTITKSEKNGETVQTFKRCALPDPAAALILLKHWDKEMEWTQDPAILRIKKAELELKRQHFEESEEWET